LLSVNQNFYKYWLFTSPSTRFRLLWFIRNLTKITLFSKNLFVNFVTTNSTIIVFWNVLHITKHCFQLLNSILLNLVYHKENFFWQSNFNLSLKFWTLTFFLSLQVPKQVLGLKPHATHFLQCHSYYKPSLFLSIEVDSKLYRKLLLKFLVFLVGYWPKYNINYIFFYSNFLFVTQDFLLLKYYNHFFFKIYRF